MLPVLTATNKNPGNGKSKSGKEGFPASAHIQIALEKDFMHLNSHILILTHPPHCQVEAFISKPESIVLQQGCSHARAMQCDDVHHGNVWFTSWKSAFYSLYI